MLLAIFITAYKRRKCTERITFKDADGDTVTLHANDKVRIKIGRSLTTPLVDLSSDAASALGSTVTKVNPVTLELSAAEMGAISPGVYDIEALVVDSADDSEIKLAEQGVFSVISTQAGGID